MPRGNGTGPMGMGPLTGRAAGICAGNGAPGYANPVAGRCGGGFGRGRGGMGGGSGRGFRKLFFATGLPGWMRGGGHAAPDRAGGFDEKQALAIHARALQAQLDGVQERLKRLETRSGAEG